MLQDGPVVRENLSEEVTRETQTSEQGALSLPGAGSVQRSHGTVFLGIFTFLFPFDLTAEGGLLKFPKRPFTMVFTSAILILGV